MAREDTLVHEISQNYPLERAIVETTAYDAVKDTTLRAMREMFSHHPEYTYVPDPVRGFGYPDLDKTRIVIWQEYPLDTLFLPAITINIGSMRDHPISFNQNMNTVDYLHDDDGNIIYNAFGQPIPNYFEYAGAWDSVLNVNINAQSPWDRDLITDYVKINFMHIYRDWLYTRGIHVKTVGTSGESQADWRNQHIYKLTLAVDIYTEWTHRIPVPTEIVESVALNIYSPISTQALVPPNGVVDGEKVESVATILSHDEQALKTYDDDRPDSAMATVEYRTATNRWEITTEWWQYIATEFDDDENLEMLQVKYGITSLSDITTEIWMSILASISSSAHLGYLRVLTDLEAAIEEAADVLGIDSEMPLPDGYQSTEYNRLLQLRLIYDALKEEYEELVQRP